MMRHCLGILLLLAASHCVSAQSVGTDTIGNASQGNVYVKRLSGDSLSTSFCIVIRGEVKPHFHRFHSEQVIVLDGSGSMTLGERTFPLRKGDAVFIPRNTVHSVTSDPKTPLRVISVQAPHFDGTDRVYTQ